MAAFPNPPVHQYRPYRHQCSTPTSRKWRPFGKRPRHHGDPQTTHHHNTTCHNLTGSNTFIGPNNTTNKDISPNRSTQRYTGPSDNNKPSLTYNKSDQTSQEIQTLVPYIANTLPSRLQTTSHDHTDSSATLPTQNHPISTSRHPFARTNERLSTHRKPTARAQLESPHRPETQTRAELHTYNRQYILRNLQQGRIDTHWQMMAEEIESSENGQDGRPVPRTTVVDDEVGPTQPTPTHNAPQTTATLRSSNSPSSQHRTDPVRWKGQN